MEVLQLSPFLVTGRRRVSLPDKQTSACVWREETFTEIDTARRSWPTQTPAR